MNAQRVMEAVTKMIEIQVEYHKMARHGPGASGGWPSSDFMKGHEPERLEAMFVKAQGDLVATLAGHEEMVLGSEAQPMVSYGDAIEFAISVHYAVSDTRYGWNREDARAVVLGLAERTGRPRGFTGRPDNAANDAIMERDKEWLAALNCSQECETVPPCPHHWKSGTGYVYGEENDG